MKKLYSFLFVVGIISSRAYAMEMDSSAKKALAEKGNKNFSSLRLIKAAKKGDLSQTKEAIEELNIAIDYKSAIDGNTALIEAVIHKHGQVIDYLLENGADIRITNSVGKTAFCYALKNKDKDTANTLINAVANKRPVS